MQELLTLDYNRQQRANRLFTEALTALEESKLDECLSLCEDVFKTTHSIEQRFGIEYIRTLTQQDPAKVKEYLARIYDCAR